MKRRAAVFIAILALACVCRAQDTSYANWPADPEWAALTNHIARCYEAILLRCQIVGVNTNWVTPPTYLFPCRDYREFAVAIDTLSPFFINIKYADAQGSYDAYFASRDGNGRTPRAFPNYTPATLHQAAGFDNWAVDSALHNWMGCDHSIQTQITAALTCLVHTVESPAVVDSPETRRADVGRWIWRGAGVDNALKSVTRFSTANAGFPACVYSHPGAPTGIENLRGFRREWSCAGDPSGYMGAEFDLGPVWRQSVTVPVTGAAYYVNLTINGRISCPDPGLQDFFSLYQDGNAILSGGIAAETIWTKTFPCEPMPIFLSLLCRFAVQQDISGDFSVETIEYVDSECSAVRDNSIISMAGNLPVQCGSAKDLYLLGADIVRDINGLTSEPVMDWRTESVPVYSDRYARVCSIAGSGSNAFFDGFCANTNMPFAGDTVNRAGFYVWDGMWLVRWQFPAVELPPAVKETPEDPDVDRDGLVDVGADVESFGADTGIIVFHPEQTAPQTYVPLINIPAWYAGLPVHGYLHDGAVNSLPYKYLSPVGYLTYDDCSSLTVDDDGLFQAFSLNTRILESGAWSDAAKHEKRVALMRPRGNVVIFDFPWLGDKFSDKGYPTGINTNRTYVLRDRTPETHTDTAYDLCFASGIYHRYGAPLKRISASGARAPLNSFYGNGWLAGVGSVDGRYTVLTSPWLDDWGKKATLIYINGTVAWQYSKLTLGWDDYQVEEGGQDSRYRLSWTRDGGKIVRVCYTPRAGGAAITTELQYDESGRIRGLLKSGITGIEKTSAFLTENRDTITGDIATTSRGQTTDAGTRTVTISRDIRDAGTVIYQFCFDSQERLTEMRRQANGGVASTRYTYLNDTGRYDNGLRKSALVESIVYPDLSRAAFAYDPVTGWLKTETRPTGYGLDFVKDYSYEKYGNGDPADPSRLVERPRRIETRAGSALVGRTLFSYSKADSVVIQVCTNSSAQWDTPGNLITTNTFHTTGIDYTRFLEETWAYQQTQSRNPHGWSYWPLNWDLSINTGFILTGIHSDGRAVVTRINSFGSTEYSETTESGQVTARISSTADPFGRILRTDYLDGSFTENRDYTIFGPQTVIGVDGAASTVEYYGNGLVRRTTDGVTGIKRESGFDALGNEVQSAITSADGKTVTTTARFDAFGRQVYLKDEFGGETVSDYLNGTCGVRRITTLPRGGQVWQFTYHDGSLRQIVGTGVKARIQKEYGVENGLFFEKTIMVGDKYEKTQWSQTFFNMFGKAFLTRHPADDGSIVETGVRFDFAGRVVGESDEESLATLRGFNSKNEVTESGLHVDGAPGALTPASRDRFQTYERKVDSAGITHSAFVYPVTGNGASELLSSSRTSLDGRNITHTYAGRVSSAGRSQFSAGGRYTVSAEESDGTRVVTDYDKWQVSEVRKYDKNGIMVEQDRRFYDGLQNLRRTETLANGQFNAVQYIRDDRQRLAQVIPSDPNKGFTVYSYFENTDLVKSIARPDATVQYEYYPNGLLKREYDFGTYDTSYTYDSQGRKRTMTTWRDGVPVVTEWIYNAYTGDLREKKLGNGIVTAQTYVYRKNGQVESITDANGVVETRQYDPQSGDLLGSSFSDGTPGIVQVYDRMGRTIGEAVAGGISQTYRKSVDGLMLAENTAGNGVVADAGVDYAYAPGSTDLAAIQFSGAMTGRVDVAYDCNCRVSGITQDVVSVVYTYVPNTRKVAETRTLVKGRTVMVRSNGWDLLNMRITNITYFAADGSNLAAFAYQYQTNSDRIARMTLMDGRYWVYEYDARGHLTLGSQRFAGGEPVLGMQFAYEYDEIGNVTKGGWIGTNGLPAYKFTSDDLNRHFLRQWGQYLPVMGSAATNAVVTVNDVATERQGERFRAIVPIKNNNKTLAVTTNIQTRAAWFSGTNDIVAESGGLVYFAQSGEGVGYRNTGEILYDSKHNYVWNARGQLISTTSRNACPDFRVEYDYYPDFRRARKTVYQRTEDGGQWTEVRRHEFYYDRWNMISESVISPQSSVVYSYTWGLDLQGQKDGKLGQNAGGIGGLLAITQVSGSTTNIYVPIPDHNGNIMALLDSAPGAIVAEYEYSPFGVLLSETSSFTFHPLVPRLAGSSFLFQSKYYDPETGLYNFGYRYYDPLSAKWLSPDPLQERGGPNLYAFCKGDPVNNVDPVGLKAYGRDFVGSLDWMDWIEQEYTQEEVDRVYAYLEKRDRHIYNPGLGNTSSDREAGRLLLEKTLGVPVAAAWNPTFARLGRSIEEVGGDIGRNGLNWNPIDQVCNVIGGVTEGAGFVLNVAGVAVDVVIAGVEKIPVIRKAEPTYQHTAYLYSKALIAVQEEAKTDANAMVYGWMHSEGAIHGATSLDNLSDTDLLYIRARTFGAGTYMFTDRARVQHFGNKTPGEWKDFVAGLAAMDWVRNKDDIHWKVVDRSYVHGFETYVQAHLIDDDPDNPFDGIAKEYFRTAAKKLLGR